MAAAARSMGPGPERRAAVGGLRNLDALTARWIDTPAKVTGLDRGVTAAAESLKRFIGTLDRPDQRALADRVDDFIGAADALLNFEFTARTANLTPRQSKELAESRKKLWREVRRTLAALINQVEDIGT